MTFDDRLLLAIGAWQKGWRDDRDLRQDLANELRDAAAMLPQPFRTANGQACYRKRFLHNGELARIFLADWRDEGLVSWTLDRSFAETFRGKFKPSAVTGAIFKRIPADEEVIVNIPALRNDPNFFKAAALYRERGRGHAEALFHFRNLHNQREIVLAAPLRASEIIALTGSSSPFDNLCDMLSLPQQGRDELFKELNKQGIVMNEPRYTNEEQTKRIIDRTQRSVCDLIAQTSTKLNP